MSNPSNHTAAASSSAAAAQASGLASASVVSALATLGVAPDVGLARDDIAARREHYGFNEVVAPRAHPVLRFLRKFWGLSAWMLELIIVLSAVLGKTSDMIVVAKLLVVNAVLGFLQEQRAAGVVETLRHQLQVRARALRDRTWQLIPARELVPGDIVRVRMGDIVPADLKLLTTPVSVDQSALTGESQEVERTVGDVLASGSIVRRGETNAVVLFTGANTSFGHTTQLVQSARPKLHIEAVVAQVVRWLFVIVIALLGAVSALSLVRGVALVEMVPLMLVRLLSAVPVALPVMFTVSMAIGSRELAKRGVLVTRQRSRCALHVQLHLAAVLRRVLDPLSARAPCLLGDAAGQSVAGRVDGRGRDRNIVDENRDAGAETAAMVGNAGRVRIRGAVVSRPERRAEGRAHPVARPSNRSKARTRSSRRIGALWHA